MCNVGRKNYSFHATSAIRNDLWICGSALMAIRAQSGAHKLAN